MTNTYTNTLGHTTSYALALASVPDDGVLQAGSFPSRESVIEAFLSRMNSSHTRRAYRRHIEAALDVIGIPLPFITGAALAKYRSQLVSSTPAPSASQALAALRSFFGWCRKGHVGISPLSSDCIEDALEMPRTHVEKPYDILTDTELSRLMEAAPTVRDRALIALMGGCGLRVSEAVALDVEDVKRTGVIHVRQGKGSKDRVVPAPGSVLLAVKRLVDENGRQNGPLFLANDRASSKRGTSRMTTRSASLALDRALAAAGIDRRISPHSLRHTYAIRFLRATKNVEALRNVLGHSSLTVTSRYSAHIAIEELQKTVPELPQC